MHNITLGLLRKGVRKILCNCHIKAIEKGGKFGSKSIAIHFSGACHE